MKKKVPGRGKPTAQDYWCSEETKNVTKSETHQEEGGPETNQECNGCELQDQ